MFLAYLYLFLFLGGDFIFDWLELVESFRLYLGASLCILSFSSCHFVFILLGYTCQGEYIFVVLVSNFLLIYDYEFFIIICLYCLCLKSRFFFSLRVFFPHMQLCILFKVFQEIYRLIHLSCCLLLQLMDSSQIKFFFFQHYFVKGFYL